MWVIIGQITWLHANYRHLDRFWPFLGHSGPQIPNLGVPFLANFFSSKYRHVGCPERCHVIPGLTTTFSNAREPTQRLKTAKKSFLRSFWTLNPNFLAIMSHWLGPLGLKRLRKAQTSHGKPRGPTQQLKTAEKLGFGVQNGHKIDFLAVLSLWVGSLAFERVAERPGITWHRSGHPTCPYFEEKKKLAENEVPKIGIWGPKWP